ncbi:unnamed protein product, partial [Iphiclides podalirius]
MSTTWLRPEQTTETKVAVLRIRSWTLESLLCHHNDCAAAFKLPPIRQKKRTPTFQNSRDGQSEKQSSTVRVWSHRQLRGRSWKAATFDTVESPRPHPKAAACQLPVHAQCRRRLVHRFYTNV